MPQRSRSWPCAFASNDRLTVELENTGRFCLTATQAGDDSVVLLSKADAEDMAWAILNPLSFFLPNDPEPIRSPDTMPFSTLRTSITSRYRDIKAAVSARYETVKEAVIGHFAEHLDAWIVFPMAFAFFTTLIFFVMAGVALFTPASFVGVLKFASMLAWALAAGFTIKHIYEEKLS